MSYNPLHFCDHDERETTLEDLEEHVDVYFSSAKTVTGLDTVKRVLYRKFDDVLKTLSKLPGAERKIVGERLNAVKVKIEENYKTQYEAITGSVSVAEIEKDLTKRIADIKHTATIAFFDAKTKEELQKKEKNISELIYSIKKDIQIKLTDDVQKKFAKLFKEVIDSIDLYYIENNKTFEKELLGDRVNTKGAKKYKSIEDKAIDSFLKRYEPLLFKAGFVVNPTASSHLEHFSRPKMLISLDQARKLGKQYDALFAKYEVKQKPTEVTPQPNTQQPEPEKKTKKNWWDKVKSFFGLKSKPKEKKPPELTKESLEEYFKDKR